MHTLAFGLQSLGPVDVALASVATCLLVGNRLYTRWWDRRYGQAG